MDLIPIEYISGVNQYNDFMDCREIDTVLINRNERKAYRMGSAFSILSSPFRI